ncbi:MFS transporter [Streptomyces sp. HPF1205]|uniref:MDR family MFS transporter n=1 Tax=Streptomyces sp. HPF1205 TaxID=2873262 RepID=UPI0021F0B582
MREAAGGLPRQFWWLWTSTLVNRLGGFVVTFLALYLTVQRGYSASYAGLVAGLFGLGGAAGAVLGGVLADRVGRRSTMLAAQLGAAATTALLGLVHHPAAIALVAAAVGLTSNASRPAVQAIIADVVPAADRVRAYSLNYWAINIGFGVSSAAAGFIASAGYLWLFLGDAFSTVVCALVVYVRVRESLPAAADTGAPAASRAHARQSTQAARTVRTAPAGPRTATRLVDVLRDQRFMVMVLCTFLLGSVMQQGNSTLAVDMGAHGLSSRQFGLAAAVNGVVIVILQLPVTRLLRGRSSASLLAIGSLVLSWGLGLTAFAGTFGLYALTVAVWTLGEIMHAPASMSVVSDLAPATARGRYQGVYSLAWSAATFAGPLLGGLAYDRLGRDAVWAGCALVGTAAATGYYLLLRVRAAASPAPLPPAATADVPADGTADGTADVLPAALPDASAGAREEPVTG